MCYKKVPLQQSELSEYEQVSCVIVVDGKRKITFLTDLKRSRK